MKFSHFRKEILHNSCVLLRFTIFKLTYLECSIKCAKFYSWKGNLQVLNDKSLLNNKLRMQINVMMLNVVVRDSNSFEVGYCV